MPNDKFRFVLNKARIGREIRLQYSVLFTYQRSHPDFPLNPDCYLPEHGLFRALQESGQTHQEALNDTTDYDPRLEKAVLEGNDREAVMLSRKAFFQALAVSIEEYFERAYPQLCIESK
jgi:hypothetical protein